MLPLQSTFTKKSVTFLFNHFLPQNAPFQAFHTLFMPFLIVVSHCAADYIFPDRIVSPQRAGLSLSYSSVFSF